METATATAPVTKTAQPQVTRARETVIVACKLPNGLILRRFKPRKFDTPVMGGGVKEIVQHFPTGEVFVVRGNAVDQESIRRGEVPALTGGFALTPGCPRDLWDEWLENNQDADMVLNGHVFAHASDADTRAQAKEHSEVKSGLEPLDPENPGPRVGDRRVQRGERTPE